MEKNNSNIFNIILFSFNLNLGVYAFLIFLGGIYRKDLANNINIIHSIKVVICLETKNNIHIVYYLVMPNRCHASFFPGVIEKAINSIDKNDYSAAMNQIDMAIASDPC